MIQWLLANSMYNVNLCRSNSADWNQAWDPGINANASCIALLPNNSVYFIGAANPSLPGVVHTDDIPLFTIKPNITNNTGALISGSGFNTGSNVFATNFAMYANMGSTQTTGLLSTKTKTSLATAGSLNGTSYSNFLLGVDAFPNNTDYGMGSGTNNILSNPTGVTEPSNVQLRFVLPIRSNKTFRVVENDELGVLPILLCDHDYCSYFNDISCMVIWVVITYFTSSTNFSRYRLINLVLNEKERIEYMNNGNYMVNNPLFYVDAIDRNRMVNGSVIKRINIHLWPLYSYNPDISLLQSGNLIDIKEARLIYGTANGYGVYPQPNPYGTWNGYNELTMNFNISNNGSYSNVNWIYIGPNTYPQTINGSSQSYEHWLPRFGTGINGFIQQYGIGIAHTPSESWLC